MKPTKFRVVQAPSLLKDKNRQFVDEGIKDLEERQRLMFLEPVVELEVFQHECLEAKYDPALRKIVYYMAVTINGQPFQLREGINMVPLSVQETVYEIRDRVRQARKFKPKSVLETEADHYYNQAIMNSVASLAAHNRDEKLKGNKNA